MSRRVASPSAPKTRSWSRTICPHTTIRLYEGVVKFIGPWDTYEFNLGNAKDLREYGHAVERSWRVAVAMVGQVMWELIEPLDDESVYARFRAEKGEGVHHIGVATPSRRDAGGSSAEKGTDVVLSGEFDGIRVAYRHPP